MYLNATCNATLNNMRLIAEDPLVGDFTFHRLGFYIAGGCTAIAVIVSLFLIWMHAIHYTKPCEQRHIIRILFMVPIYATASLLSFLFYWHAIYFQVISNCYEAFAIASFFALECHYTAPNLHDQKDYFRGINPRPWLWPLSWMRACCCGERGPWRTPRSGLTWFNIIWCGIYQYCFIRVAMTIVAVVTQYFDKYCESSNSPVFAHIWVLVIDAAAVTVAMYSLIQFYVQTRFHLAPYSPFIKVLAIKLVVFLSFWQSFMISILTSPTLQILKASPKLGWPDILVGIPSLLLCIEMAIFAFLHLFAFPYKPYTSKAEPFKYPVSGQDHIDHGFNAVGPKKGGPLGIYAIIDALNPWDLVKAFGRGIRWAFIGRRHRETDMSYKVSSNDLTLEPTTTGDNSYRSQVHLPISEEFRRSKFGMPKNLDENSGLIEHAQPQPQSKWGKYMPAKERYDPKTGEEIRAVGVLHSAGSDYTYDPHPGQPVGVGSVPIPFNEEDSVVCYEAQVIPGVVESHQSHSMQALRQPEQNATHQILKGQGFPPENRGPPPPAQGDSGVPF